MADDFAPFIEARTVCPSCGGKLTRTEQLGESVQLMHALPACSEFRRFVAQLVERNRDLQSREGYG